VRGHLRRIGLARIGLEKVRKEKIVNCQNPVVPEASKPFLVLDDQYRHFKNMVESVFDV
jgi:hypothetical protein